MRPVPFLVGCSISGGGSQLGQGSTWAPSGPWIRWASPCAFSDWLFCPPPGIEQLLRVGLSLGGIPSGGSSRSSQAELIHGERPSTAFQGLPTTGPTEGFAPATLEGPNWGDRR